MACLANAATTPACVCGGREGVEVFDDLNSMYSP